MDERNGNQVMVMVRNKVSTAQCLSNLFAFKNELQIDLNNRHDWRKACIYFFPPDEEAEFVSEIVCETENPKAGQLVTVACTIQGQDIKNSYITWFKGVYPYEKDDVIQKIPLPDGGFKSTLTFTPNEEDNGILLQCDVITEMEPVSKYFTLQLSWSIGANVQLFF